MQQILEFCPHLEKNAGLRRLTFCHEEHHSNAKYISVRDILNATGVIPTSGNFALKFTANFHG
jgi:hypothetical protein